MTDSDDEEYFWYSDPEIEEDEVWSPEDKWTQSIHTDSNTRQMGQTCYTDEFDRFADWRYGMPSPCAISTARPRILHSTERNYAELRRRKFLCLHYFSNMLGFSFDDKNEDVYPLDSIQEWNDIKGGDEGWGDMLKQHIQNGKA